MPKPAALPIFWQILLQLLLFLLILDALILDTLSPDTLTPETLILSMSIKLMPVLLKGWKPELPLLRQRNIILRKLMSIKYQVSIIKNLLLVKNKKPQPLLCWHQLAISNPQSAT